MWNLSETEDNIITAIDFLRNNKRQRPTTKFIFDEINKNQNESDKIDISVFKEAILNLQSQQIIYDGGKDGKESFFLNENIVDDAEVNNFINDKLYETLLNRIKLEVKTELSQL